MTRRLSFSVASAPRLDGELPRQERDPLDGLVPGQALVDLLDLLLHVRLKTGQRTAASGVRAGGGGCRLLRSAATRQVEGSRAKKPRRPAVPMATACETAAICLSLPSSAGAMFFPPEVMRSSFCGR